MAINKVVYGQNTLIDLTGDTVSDNKMLSGIIAHDKSGGRITGSIPSKSAATITPTTSAQTIAAGQYLSGAQTIVGDANLTAANIADGVNIFGVTGTYKGAVVQTATGVIETTDENGHAAINCGFVPDIVMIDDHPLSAVIRGRTVYDRAVATYIGLPANSWHESYSVHNRDKFGFTGVILYTSRPTANGFEVYVTLHEWTWNDVTITSDLYPLMSEKLEYMAYKFL